MKKRIMNTRITGALASLALLVGMTACAEKDIAPPEAGTNMVNLRFEVECPQMTGSKVAFDGNHSFAWTGNETLSVLVGTSGTTTSKSEGLQIILNPSSTPGVFEGEVDLGEFSPSDIQAIVVPGDHGAYFAYNNSKDRVMMKIPAEQSQAVSGVFNPVYNPFFADLESSESDADGKYTFSGIQLNSVTDLICFNVYGQHPDQLAGEILKAVEVTASNTIGGEARRNINLADPESDTCYGTGSKSSTVTVSLEQELTIADRTSANPVQVFASIIIPGAARDVTEVKVYTDKAIYTKTVSGVTLEEKNVYNPVNVINAGLNLANGFTRKAIVYQTSVDGQNWVDGLTAESGDKLYVRTENFVLTETHLESIKTWVASQSAPVALDMSAATYESATFPATFAGTESAPFTKLSSIKFPAGVTGIAEKAFYYCTSLSSVDLTGIAKLGMESFRYCSLVNLTVPSSVTSFGQYVFANNAALTSVYYNAVNPTKENKRWEIFQEKDLSTPEMTITIGPDAAILPRATLRDNLKLVKLVVEEVAYWCPYQLVGCKNLAVIEFLSTDVTRISDPTVFDTGTMWDSGHVKPGSNLETKQVIVPAGLKETYSETEVVKGLIEVGYTVVEAAAEDTGAIEE